MIIWRKRCVKNQLLGIKLTQEAIDKAANNKLWLANRINQVHNL